MSSSDYEVGYRKPPKNRQFQKGRSGNSLGRPRGSKNIVLLMARQLRNKMNATIDGQSKRITMAEAIVLQMLRKALTGDTRAIQQVIQLQAVAEQLRRSQEQEVFDSINFEGMSIKDLEKILLLTASPEVWKAAGVEQPMDLKMARKYFGKRTDF